MSSTVKPQLTMIFPNIRELPSVNLPPGYHCRHFLPGDEMHWNRIISDSFGQFHDFKEFMMKDSVFSPERVWFICDHDWPVATASAWHESDAVGVLHMVGRQNDHAGKGVGYLASLAALHQMKKEGKVCATLSTDDHRIPAIKTYLKLGFLPLISHESHEQRWRDILPSVNVRFVFSDPLSVMVTT